MYIKYSTKNRKEARLGAVDLGKDSHVTALKS